MKFHVGIFEMNIIENNILEAVFDGKTIAESNREKRLNRARKNKKEKESLKKLVERAVRESKDELCRGMPAGSKVSGTVEVSTPASSSSYSFSDIC